MDRRTVALQVFFEDPFWVGVLERGSGRELTVCKITFGPEPKDYELSSYFLKNYYRLHFSPAVTASAREMPGNPKRVQRQVQKLLKTPGMGTKSQQALKLQQEQKKTERRQISRERREAEKQRLFEQKQQKRKEKHRGR